MNGSNVYDNTNDDTYNGLKSHFIAEFDDN